MKKRYKQPVINAVVLDKEISLQLASHNEPTIDKGIEKPLGSSEAARHNDPYQYEGW